jgi:hypothetical protein
MLSKMVQSCKPGKAATGALQGPPPVVTQVTLVAFEDDLAIKAMSITQSSLHGLNVETSKVCYYVMWESKPLLFCYQINKKGSEFIGRLSTATHSTYDLNGMFPPLGWRRLDAPDDDYSLFDINHEYQLESLARIAKHIHSSYVYR